MIAGFLAADMLIGDPSVIIIALLFCIVYLLYNYIHKDDATIRANHERCEAWTKALERGKAREAESARRELIRIADFFAGIGKGSTEVIDSVDRVEQETDQDPM